MEQKLTEVPDEVLEEERDFLRGIRNQLLSLTLANQDLINRIKPRICAIKHELARRTEETPL